MRESSRSEAGGISVGDLLRVPLDLPADLQAAYHGRSGSAAELDSEASIRTPMARSIGTSSSDLPSTDLLAVRALADAIRRAACVRTSRSHVTTEVCVGHWGEAGQGGVRYQGRVRTLLLTLIDRTVYALVAVIVSAGRGRVFVDDHRTKLRFAVEEILRRARRNDVNVRVFVLASPPAGIGAGSSSAELTATIRAVARLLGLRLSDMQVARIAWHAERATDPLAFAGWGITPVWASRQGEIVEVVHAPIPPILCVGLVGGPGEVNTLAQADRTSYDAAEIREFASIYRRLTRAIERQSPLDFVRAGSDSLALNQTRCPTPRFAELQNLAQQVGALGVLGSHSGTAAVLAFDARSEGITREIAIAVDHARTRGFDLVHCFSAP